MKTRKVGKGWKLGLMGLAATLVPASLGALDIGPRVGVTMPVATEEQTYDPSFLVGGSLGLGDRLRIGVDVDYSYTSGQYIETDVLIPRVNASYSFPLGGISPYVLGGVNMLFENSKINIPQINVSDEVSNSTFGMEFGAGITFGAFDVRATYSFMPSSENVKGMVNVTGSYRLRF